MEYIDTSVENIMKFLWETKGILVFKKIENWDIDASASEHHLPSPIAKYMEDLKIVRNEGKILPRYVWLNNPTDKIAVRLRECILRGQEENMEIDIPDGLTKIETDLFKFIHHFSNECSKGEKFTNISALYDKFHVPDSCQRIISNRYAWNSSGIRNKPEWIWRDNYKLSVETVRNIIAEAKEMTKKYAEAAKHSVCTCCGQSKPIEKFRPDWRYISGYDPYCMMCNSLRKK